MIALAFACLLFGALGSVICRPSKSHDVWDWRDLFSTLPLWIGILLGIAGVFVWLWRVAP